MAISAHPRTPGRRYVARERRRAEAQVGSAKFACDSNGMYVVYTMAISTRKRALTASAAHPPYTATQRANPYTAGVAAPAVSRTKSRTARANASRLWRMINV